MSDDKIKDTYSMDLPDCLKVTERMMYLEALNAELLAACKAVEETGVIVTIGLMTQIRAAIAAAEGE